MGLQLAAALCQHSHNWSTKVHPLVEPRVVVPFVAVDEACELKICAICIITRATTSWNHSSTCDFGICFSVCERLVYVPFARNTEVIECIRIPNVFQMLSQTISALHMHVATCAILHDEE